MALRGKLSFISSTTSCQKMYYRQVIILNYLDMYYPGLLSGLLYHPTAYKMNIWLSLVAKKSKSTLVSHSYFLVVIHYFLWATSVPCTSITALNKWIGFVYNWSSQPQTLSSRKNGCVWSVPILKMQSAWLKLRTHGGKKLLVICEENTRELK